MSVEKAIREAEAILPGVAAPDGEIDPRWQAIIKIGRFIEFDPEPVWEFSARWGCHSDWDLRAAIACCLLEHLLEHHFSSLFPRAAALAQENRYFADTLRQCSKFGLSEVPENARQFDELICRLFPESAA